MGRGAGSKRERSTTPEVPQSSPGKKAVGGSRYTLARFLRFCSELRTEDGRPLKIEPFQKRILKDHFAGTTEEVVILPKKNGKSTVFAALALFHLETWEEPEVVIGASSRDQATILFNQAAKMVARSGLESRFDVKGGYRHIRLRANPSAHIRVLAADAKTADGVIPTLALVDELHRHPSGDLYGVFRDGLDARNGRMVTMSTAGLQEDSALGLLRKRAKEIGYSRKGAYAHAASRDGSFVLHEWSLEDTDDLDDLKLVKKANPASWQTIPKLRARKESPAMTPGRWARFACGVWTEGEDPWVEAKKWDALKVDIGRVAEGESVCVAVDVGVNPGIALAAPRADDGVAVKVEVFEGDIPLEVIENRLVELSEIYQLREVSYDKANFLRSAELLEQRGLPMIEMPHSPERLSIVSTTLRELIEGNRLRHDGDDALRAQVLAGTIKETERGWRLIKSYRTRGLIALAVAAHQATQTHNSPEIMVAWR